MAEVRPVRLQIIGRVQGVGFREFVRRQALARNLDGWVRNRGDRSVEAVVVGPAAEVDAMVAACQEGPPAAAVRDVRAVDYDGPFLAGFMILPTE